MIRGDAGQGRATAVMKLEGISFQAVDWSRVEPTRHPGNPGEATWRTVEAGNARVRMVEYSPGYVADHWCRAGVSVTTWSA